MASSRCSGRCFWPCPGAGRNCRNRVRSSLSRKKYRPECVLQVYLRNPARKDHCPPLFRVDSSGSPCQTSPGDGTALCASNPMTNPDLRRLLNRRAIIARMARLSHTATSRRRSPRCPLAACARVIASLRDCTPPPMHTRSLVTAPDCRSGGYGLESRCPRLRPQIVCSWIRTGRLSAQQADGLQGRWIVRADSLKTTSEQSLHPRIQRTRVPTIDKGLTARDRTPQV
jgi:hypothetical protein